jgi:hypothetical protein
MLLEVSSSIQVKPLHSKLLHKTQSHCSPNFIFADVLNNSYMHTIYFFKKTKIPRFEKYKVKVEGLENITVLNILV